jgi:class 3 adenylate cyclase
VNCVKKKSIFRHQKILKSFSLAVILLSFFTSCNYDSSDNPSAVKGVMDLNHYFLSHSSNIYLDGEWCFYPDRLLMPEEIKDSLPSEIISVPGLWKKNILQSDIKTGTYRLLIVNHGLSPVFSIRNHQIFSAFKLFLNGEEILMNGKVASARGDEIPCYKPRTISVYANSDTLELVLQVSNHHYNSGGIAESFIIGNSENLLRNNMARSGIDFFLTGSLLIMAIYYLSLFFVMKKEQSSLYFSIFIFLSILRILVSGQRLLLFVFPDLPWTLMLRLEYGSFYLAPVFFILFFNAIFREEIKIYVVNLVLLVSGLFTFSVLITPVKIFSAVLPFYQVYIGILAVFMIYWLWKARINSKEGAFALLIGIIILFLTLLHDMVFAMGNIRGGELFPAGIFIFILCQSYVLSVKFSAINRENQKLWEENDYKNQHLERLVKDRTRELEEQKDLLQKANIELEQKRQSVEDQREIMEEINEMLEKEKKRTDQLLLNVLPRHIADELRIFGKSLAHSYPQVSVLFVDFVRFSDLTENLKPSSLLEELHFYFAGFDDIARKYNLEKIKTIGDAYMCAGGLHENPSALDVRNTVLAALEISMFIQSHKEEKLNLGDPWFDCRIGIHTGPVIAGVVGKSKFAFDIWGSTVNVAKRMEAACEPGKVNISEFTYQYIKNDFKCYSRGIISMKHKKNMQMFFVEKFLG